MAEFDPFVEISKIQRRISKGISTALKGYKKPFGHMTQNSKFVYAEFKLPGMEKKDIDFKINNRHITVSAEKKKQIKTIDGQDSVEANYFRKISLPSGVNPDKAQVTFSDGILKISIPRKKIK